MPAALTISVPLDVVLLGSFYALPTFVRDYGELQADGTYNISSAWQAGLSNAVQVGSIIGLLLNGCELARRRDFQDRG